MEIVLAGPREQQAGMLAEIRKHFLPNAVVMQASEAPTPMPPVDDRATALFAHLCVGCFAFFDIQRAQFTPVPGCNADVR